MNARLDHSPIPVGKVLPNHSHAPAAFLEPARVQPCYAGQDEMADYAQTMPRHVKPTDIDELTTQAERQETTLRRMVSDADFTQALDFLHERAELPDWVWHRMEEVAMEFAEKRLNRGQS